MKAVAEFYDQHPYPTKQTSFVRPVDPEFWAPFPYQDVGHWSRRVDANTRVLVVGCGTNQAIEVALRWPMAKVDAFDASARTIEHVEGVRKRLGLENLRLEVCDFDHISPELFSPPTYDIIICTGVAHHFDCAIEDWMQGLHDLLKPDGLLELLVYNETHRLAGHRFQNALMLLHGKAPTLEQAWALLKVYAHASPEGAAFADLVTRVPPMERADMLIHPRETLYTLTGVQLAAYDAKLIPLQPVQWGAFGQLDEHLRPLFDSEWGEHGREVVQQAIADHLLGCKTDLIWFYLQREDSPHPAKSTAQIARELTGLRTGPHRTALERWEDGKWADGGPFPREEARADTHPSNARMLNPRLCVLP